MNYDVGVFTRRRIISPAESYFAVPVGVVGYVGPGNVAPSTARGWYGLRAYTTALAGSATNVIRLRRDGASVGSQDFATLSTGGLDLPAIATFFAGSAGASNLWVESLYDQTGNGLTATQAATGQQPVFSLTAGLNSTPGMVFDGVDDLFTITGLSANNQPFTMSVVAKNNGAGPAAFLALGSLTAMAYASGSNTWVTWAGTDLPIAATDSAFHAGQFIQNTTSSYIYVDGASSTGTAGTNAPGTADGKIGYDGFNQHISGVICEIGFWESAFSFPTNMAAMNANQHSNTVYGSW